MEGLARAGKTIKKLAAVLLQINKIRAEKAAEKDAKKPITSQYPTDTLLPRLYAMTDINAEDLLPSVYAKIANAPKQIGKHTTIQMEVDVLARELEITSPVVQIGMSAHFVNLRFHGTNKYELGNGLLPMNIVPNKTMSAPGHGLTEKMLQANEKLHIMLEADSIQGSDVAGMNTTKYYLPACFEEAFLMLKEYAVVLGTALGITYGVYLDYKGALRLICLRPMAFMGALCQVYGKRASLPLLVFFFHYYLRTWFQMQFESNAKV